MVTLLRLTIAGPLIGSIAEAYAAMDERRALRICAGAWNVFLIRCCALTRISHRETGIW